ncbi:MAG: hypothetical protein HYY84_00575 [Deltaproteobacteria bacterium]|nr:hypothetical protein [Deltaproteobacteria bacterium]
MSDDDKPRTPLRPAAAAVPGWEGIVLRAPREVSWARALVSPPPYNPSGKKFARMVVVGYAMSRPSIRRGAESDWAFSTYPSPMLVLRDGATGELIKRASVDRIHAEYRAIVDGMSISYAQPQPPTPSIPDDNGRRDGGPFEVDIGFYLTEPTAPRELRVHAELGPLRSNEVTIRLVP